MKENSNGNDTNVGSIENNIQEDINILNDFIEGNFQKDKLENYKGSYKMGYFYYKDIRQTIEHILSDYKKLQEEFKQVDHECERLEEKEVRLIKENEQLKEYIAIAPNLDEMTAIKYRNIRQDAYIQGRAEEQQKARQIINENYIPVQKIKDKIEDLKMSGGSNGKDNTENTVREWVIEVLQDILDESSENKNE